MAPFTEKRFLPRRAADQEERRQLEETIRGRLSGEPDIAFAYLHGSFVTEGTFRDIDVAVYTRIKKDFAVESDLSYELSKLTGHEVEVKIINEAPVAFQMAVLRGGRSLFSVDDEMRTDFIESVGRKYREYAHFRNVFMEAVGAER